MGISWHDNTCGYACANRDRLVVVAVIGLGDDKRQTGPGQILREILYFDALSSVHLASRFYVARLLTRIALEGKRSNQAPLRVFVRCQIAYPSAIRQIT